MSDYIDGKANDVFLWVNCPYCCVSSGRYCITIWGVPRRYAHAKRINRYYALAKTLPSHG